MEAPKLTEVLQMMKNTLDSVNEQFRMLTKQVKDNQLLTADGISYLETKHLLMLSCCQCIVYYVLRKAKGLSIQNHPLVRSLVEIKLFIEKIHPIDKKFDYQVQKILKLVDNTKNNNNMVENTKESKEANSMFRPNPDMLLPKFNVDGQADGLYRVSKFGSTWMDAGKLFKEENKAKKSEKELLLRSLLKENLNDFVDKPEELDNSVAPDSTEVSKYLSKLREQASQEEELFARAPNKHKKRERRLIWNSRNGMACLTDGLDDVLKTLRRSKDDTDSFTTKTTASKRKGCKRRKRQSTE